MKCCICGKSPVLWELRYLEVSKARVYYLCSNSCLRALLDNTFFAMQTEEFRPFKPIEEDTK
jgi:hypothetical protein